MDVRKQIEQALSGILKAQGVEDVTVLVTQPELSHGDYTTNLAMILASKLRQSPFEIAGKIQAELQEKRIEGIESIDVVKPGFINFHLSTEALSHVLEEKAFFRNKALQSKKYLVEYAHPNTHKEMHIGHMRTLITGEAIARLLEANGGEVFRANYQGDIGPHVAKALYGIQVLMEERGLTLDEIEKWTNTDKAHFLGEGYVRGNIDYENNKTTIDSLNSDLYQMIGDQSLIDEIENGRKKWEDYQRTRRWSLDYYDEFYQRFYTRFNKLFFESQMVVTGKQIVLNNLGKVFKEDNGAIVFPGETYGLHTRVFITQVGNPTYEGKEMGNAFAEQKAFPFDEKIHVVASEQAGYFQVVFKALDLIDPEKFEEKQLHISMGMINLSNVTVNPPALKAKASVLPPSVNSSVVNGIEEKKTDRVEDDTSASVVKMSSRTGLILKVDWLIDQVKDKIRSMVEEGRIKSEDKEEVTEMVAVGAIKYSVLKVGTGQNVAFDIERSVSLEGDSGPYIQYTYARTQSVLTKSKEQGGEQENIEASAMEEEEHDLLRMLYRFSSVVEQAGTQYSPNVLCDYLYDLAKLYNLFYQKHKILGNEHEVFRLSLTQATGSTLKEGLSLLGIKAPQRM